VQAQYWDLIILGAGTAGLALATRLCHHKRVLVIEKRSLSDQRPRIGESLPGAASVLLKRLGVWNSFCNGNHRTRGSSVSLWDATFPVWRDALRDPAGAGWIINRTAFENMLCDEAIKAGATVLDSCRQYSFSKTGEGWSVHIKQTDQTHRSPILIDATGRSASIARRLGAEYAAQDSLLCMYSFLSQQQDDPDASMRIVADEHGWWYTVQIPGKKRVLAYHLDIDNPLRESLKEPVSFFNRALATPLINDVLGSWQAGEIHFKPAGTSVIDVTTLAATGAGFLPIGDAVIAFDPISSQGLFNALATAESASAAIMNGFPNNAETFHQYCAELKQVSERYLSHLQQTYAGPVRFANSAFWKTRRKLQNAAITA